MSAGCGERTRRDAKPFTHVEAYTGRPSRCVCQPPIGDGRKAVVVNNPKNSANLVMRLRTTCKYFFVGDSLMERFSFQSLFDGISGGFGLIILIEWQSLAVARIFPWNPAIFVGEPPC